MKWFIEQPMKPFKKLINSLYSRVCQSCQKYFLQSIVDSNKNQKWDFSPLLLSSEESSSSFLVDFKWSFRSISSRRLMSKGHFKHQKTTLQKMIKRPGNERRDGLKVCVWMSASVCACVWERDRTGIVKLLLVVLLFCAEIFLIDPN